VPIDTLRYASFDNEHRDNHSNASLPTKQQQQHLSFLPLKSLDTTIDNHHNNNVQSHHFLAKHNTVSDMQMCIVSSQEGMNLHQLDGNKHIQVVIVW